MKTYRFALLLLLGGATLAAGCAPVGSARYPDSRRPDVRYPDSRRAPDVRLPAPRRTSAAVYARANRDAERYVRMLDRRLRLNRQQERRIQALLADRAYERVARKARRDRERAYPFPRDARDRVNRKWWKKADKRIERVLNRKQRRAYRALVREHRYERRGDRRDDRNRRRHDRRWND